MNIDYPRLKSAAMAATWAIDRVWLEASLEQVREDKAFSRTSRLPHAKGNVAVIPIHGMITQRGSIFGFAFGGTSTNAFEAAFSKALASDRVGAIVLDIDSPGGTTAGVQETAERVFAARGNGKPIVSVANSLAASAAYWIGSAAEQFVAAPGADVGSIGVFRMHEDISGAMEQMGVSVKFLAVPPGKVAGNPFEPLSDAQIEHEMDQVRETFDEFAGAVGRHRPELTKADVVKLDGQTFHAKSAKGMGLVDRVATLGKVLQELGVGNQPINAELGADLCSAWASEDITAQRLRHKAIERRRLAIDRRI